MIRKTVFFAILILILQIATPASAEMAKVIEGVAEVNMEQRDKTVPLVIGITIFEKKSDSTYRKISEIPLNIDEEDSRKKWANEAQNMINSQSLAGWSTNRPKIINVPGGHNAPLVAAFNLQFAGVKNIKSVNSSIGGVTPIPISEIRNWGRITFVDLQELPYAGPQFVHLGLCHKDDFDKYRALFGLLNWTVSREGIVSAVVEINVVTDVPENFRNYSPNAKKSFIHGMNRNIAYTDNPELVKNEEKQIRNNVRQNSYNQQIESKANLILKGKPFQKFACGYVGSEIQKSNLNNVGEASITLSSGKSFKVMSLDGSFRQDVVLSPNETKTIYLNSNDDVSNDNYHKTNDIREIRESTNNIKSNNLPNDIGNIYKFRVNNYSMNIYNIKVVAECPNGNIKTATSTIGPRKYHYWEIEENSRVRFINLNTGRYTKIYNMKKNYELNIDNLIFSEVQ